MQDFAQKYESTIEVSLAAFSLLRLQGHGNKVAEVLAGRGAAGATSHPSCTLHFLSFLRPTVIGALFGEINCCVVNGLDRTSRPLGGAQEGGGRSVVSSDWTEGRDSTALPKVPPAR